MKTVQIIRHIINLLLPLLCLSCTPQITELFKPPLGEDGELYLYLQPLPQEMLPLTFTISGIEAIDVQGATIPLLTGELQIKGQNLFNTQKRLAANTLPPGRYQGLSLSITKATITGEEGDAALLPPENTLRFDLDFTVARGESLALFLELSPEYLVTDTIRFSPRFVLARSHKHPRNFLGFISNVTENTVTVFNKRSMEVVEVIHAGAEPRGLALDQERGIVYVALAGEDEIVLINVDSLELYARIKLHFGDEPVEISLTEDGETLLSANYGSGTVSIIDTRSLLESVRFSLEPDPVWVVSDRAGQKAYVLHGLPNTVSIIDLPGRRIQSTFSLDDSPLRAGLNLEGDSLYIVSPFSSDLWVVDTNTRGITATIFTGRNASSLKVDPKSSLVYIGKESGDIAVVDPSSGIFIDSFRIDGPVDFMAVDGEENTLLTVSAESSMVRKINLVSKKQLAGLDTVGTPHAVAVMGEL